MPMPPRGHPAHPEMLGIYGPPGTRAPINPGAADSGTPDPGATAAVPSAGQTGRRSRSGIASRAPETPTADEKRGAAEARNRAQTAIADRKTAVCRAFVEAMAKAGNPGSRLVRHGETNVKTRCWAIGTKTVAGDSNNDHHTRYFLAVDGCVYKGQAAIEIRRWRTARTVETLASTSIPSRQWLAGRLATVAAANRIDFEPGS